MTESVAIVQSEIKTLFAGDASGHDYWHTLRVYRLARHLAEAYPCDETLVALAALLHDADVPKTPAEMTESEIHARALEIERQMLLEKRAAEGSSASTPDAIDA